MRSFEWANNNYLLANLLPNTFVNHPFGLARPSRLENELFLLFKASIFYFKVMIIIEVEIEATIYLDIQKKVLV